MYKAQKDRTVMGQFSSFKHVLASSAGKTVDVEVYSSLKICVGVTHFTVPAASTRREQKTKTIDDSCGDVSQIRI